MYRQICLGTFVCLSKPNYWVFCFFVAHSEKILVHEIWAFATKYQKSNFINYDAFSGIHSKQIVGVKVVWVDFVWVDCVKVVWVDFEDRSILCSS